MWSSMLGILLLLIWALLSNRLQREMNVSPVTKWARDNKYEVLSLENGYWPVLFPCSQFHVRIRDQAGQERCCQVHASTLSGLVEKVEWEGSWV